MKVISVINYKGGVGKTTLTANIAAELAFRGKRVLLLDADPQCSLTFSFVSPEYWEENLGGDGEEGGDKTIKRWFDGISGDDEIAVPGLGDLIVPDLKVLSALGGNGGRIDLIPSHLGLINVDLDLAYMLSGVPPGRADKRFVKVYGHLRKALTEFAAESDCDIALIDCPPNFNIVTKNAITASDGILIPAKPDHLSTLGINYLVRSYGQHVDEFNRKASSAKDKIAPKILGVVFTMIQKWGGEPIAPQKEYMSLDNISEAPVIFDEWVTENKSFFPDASKGGIPFVLGKGRPPYSEIVAEIKSVTDEFLAKMENLP